MTEEGKGSAPFWGCREAHKTILQTTSRNHPCCTCPCVFLHRCLLSMVHHSCAEGARALERLGLPQAPGGPSVDGVWPCMRSMIEGWAPSLNWVGPHLLAWSALVPHCCASLAAPLAGPLSSSCVASANHLQPQPCGTHSSPCSRLGLALYLQPSCIQAPLPGKPPPSPCAQACFICAVHADAP